MQVFIDVCETLNFTKTAERLYLSQQGVSRHIADLEREFGVRLFDRAPHRMELTEAGREACAFFSEFEDRYTTLLKRWRDQGDAVPDGNVLRLGYQDFLRFGTALRDGFKQYCRQVPGARVEGRRGDPAELISLLDGGDIDAAIMLSRFLGKADGLVVRRLRPSQLMLYVAKDNPLNEQEGDWQKFRREPLLINAFEGEEPATALRREKRKARARRIAPREIIVLNNRGSIYTEAYMDRGVFFGSAYADIPEDVPLVCYPTPFDDSFCFVYPEATDDARLDRFAACLEESFRLVEPPSRAFA